MGIDYRLGEMAKVFACRHSREASNIRLEKQYGHVWRKTVRKHADSVEYARDMLEAARIAQHIKDAFEVGWCLACEAKEANIKPVKKAKKGAKR